MKNELKILVAGGDMRQIYCAARLSGEFDISAAGFDKDMLPEKTNIKEVDLNESGIYDCIVLPVLPINSDGSLNAPCSSRKIPISVLKSLLRENGIVFAGKVDSRLSSVFSDAEIYDYMEREELTLKNAVPTAEGAVQIALEELPVTLNGMKVLIAGMGRIGTALAVILKGFGADVTAAVRNARGTAKARIAGIKSVCTSDMTADYELVFNTVPNLIFDKKLLARFGKDTLFIDLASKPGGIDFVSAQELGIKVIWALGLPGKTAPVSAGEIIAETISGILTERSGIYE